MATIGLGLALAVGWQARSAAEAEAAPCTFGQMELDARSVIAPCSTMIENQTLQPDVRADALFIRGRAYARTARTSLAAQDYDVAIKLAPDRSDYYVSRASTEMRSDRYGDAVTDLNRALSLDPHNARAYRALGGAYLNYGRVDDGMRLLTAALNIDPHEPYALLMRIGLFEQKRQMTEAMADANALVDIPAAEINRLGYVGVNAVLEDFHAKALIRRAALHEAMGDDSAASRDLDSAIAQAASPSSLRARADFLANRGRSEEALRDYEAVLKLDQQDAGAYFGKGIALMEQNKFDLAVDAFDTAAKFFCRDCNNRYDVASNMRFKARALRGLGHTDEAVVAIETAVASSGDVLRETSLAMVRRGYWSKADPTPVVTDDYKAALRACMIDPDCN